MTMTKEEKTLKIKALVEKVSAMSEEQKKALVERFGAVATVEGKVLSLHNSCMVISQCAEPETTLLVGGYQQWLKAGRQVKKGEKALYILAPRMGKNDKDESVCKGFTTIAVFSLDQTEELAKLAA